MDLDLTLYTRSSCPLCDEMEAALAGTAIGVERVDVDSSRSLQDRYGMRVPVLEAGGRVIAEGRVEPAALRAAIEQLNGEAPT